MKQKIKRFFKILIGVSLIELIYLISKKFLMSELIIDVIENTLPSYRPLEIRDSKEFISVSQRVREGLRSGHSYE